MGDLRDLFRVGRQMRSLRVCNFRRVDHSPVVGQRRRGPVVQAVASHVSGALIMHVFPLVIVVTGWRSLRGFRRVGGQVDRFRVSNFRCVDHPSIVGQRRRRAVVRWRPVGGVAGSCEDEARERELKSTIFYY